MYHIALVLAFAVPSTEGCQQEKLTPPSSREQRETLTKIKEAFKAAYSTGDPQLPAKLLAAAGESEDPVVRFVLLSEARDASVAQVDLKLALRAMLRIHTLYDIDDVKMVDKLLSDTRRLARTPDQVEQFLQAILELAKRGADTKVPDPDLLTGAVVESEHPSAWIVRALKQAGRIAKSARQRKAAVQIKAYILKLERKRDAELAARILADNEDPRASTQFGSYLCFEVGDWETGLTHLAKSDDKTLVALAKAEIGIKEESDGFGRLGDQWQKASRTRKDDEPGQFTSRALFWYRRAVSSAPVLEKGKWRDRLLEALRGRDGMLDLLPIVDLSRTQDTWRIQEDALVNEPRPAGSGSWITIPYVPPLEYDLTFMAERVEGSRFLHVGILGGGKRAQLILDGTFDFSGLDGVDGKGARENETGFKGKLLPQGKPVKVECNVRRGSVTVTVGGRRVVNWKADWGRLQFDKAPHDRALYFRTLWMVWRISDIRVRPLGGLGELLN